MRDDLDQFAASTHRLADTGFTGALGDYIVDIEYRNVYRLKPFHTEFAPYCTIVPIP